MTLDGVGWTASAQISTATIPITKVVNGAFATSNTLANNQYFTLEGKFEDHVLKGKASMNYKDPHAYRKAVGDITLILTKQNDTVTIQPTATITLKSGTTSAQPENASNSNESINNEKQKALDWMAKNNKWGSEEELYKFFLAQLQQVIDKEENAEWHMGWGLTKSQKPYYLTWINGVFRFEEMSMKEAKKQKMKADDLNIQFDKK